jgi:uncharacterized membrane protein
VLAAKIFTGPGLILSGILHFAIPKTYIAIVPESYPAKRELVYASGVTELAAGIGSLHPATRRAAGWLGILTMLGVYPANVQMALNPGKYSQIPSAALWARLPLQGVFIWWIYEVCLKRA